MSKISRLKNAPLLEVIFELQWDMSNKDWENYPYLHGDLYEKMKTDYSDREVLLPPYLPKQILEGKVQYRFKQNNGYPLFQLGAGVLTFHATDEEYEWDIYNSKIEGLLDSFFSVNNIGKKEYLPTLSYYDFLKVDLNSNNVFEYISKHLNLDIEQNAHKFEQNPHDFNFGFSYNIGFANLNVRIDSGQKDDDNKGLIVQTQLNAVSRYNRKSETMSWLDMAHDFTSQYFKDLTEGELYESFNK